TIYHALYFEAETSTAESSFANNSDKILFGDLGIAYSLGDANADGNIDNRDAALLLRYISGISDEINIDLEAADYNADGYIDLKDVTALLSAIGE
ncbi:MAG: dockerin type I repeat-containing protein, partial [Clostridiales bacterium]|nr:dockerin type I repeat-containing protein [Clostridiales bacterium]